MFRQASCVVVEYCVMLSDLLEEAGQERADDAVLSRRLRMNTRFYGDILNGW